MLKCDFDYLKKEQSNGKKIAIYCAGKYGLLIFKIMELCEIRIDVFLDSDHNKWEIEIKKDVYCLNPHEINNKKDYYIIIAIQFEHYETVEKEIKKMGFSNIIDYGSLLDYIILNDRYHYSELFKLSNEIIDEDLFFQPFMKNCVCNYKKNDKNKHMRIAVYTGVFGDYDELIEPKVSPDNIDYYLISDDKPSKTSLFKWINAKDVIPPEITSPIKRNRYVKMHPHILFPQYEYSIYMDGNVSIEKDISTFVDSNRTGISVFLHHKRDCIFYEALTVVYFKRVAEEDVYKQMSKYLQEGMPLHYGLTHMAIIAREHHNPICIKIMEDWWKEFSEEAQRDQLSFTYIMWKNGLELSDISLLGENLYNIEEVSVSRHPHESKLIKDLSQ